MPPQGNARAFASLTSPPQPKKQNEIKSGSVVLLTIIPQPPTVWLLQVPPSLILRMFDLVTAYVLEAYLPLFTKKKPVWFFPHVHPAALCVAVLCAHSLIPTLSAPARGLRPWLVSCNSTHCRPRIHFLHYVLLLKENTIKSKARAICQTGSSLRWGHACHMRQGTDCLFPEDRTTSVPHPGE